MGNLDLACKHLLRARPHDLLGLLPGVAPERSLRLLDKEFTATPPMPRALDGCVELSDEGDKGTIFHVEFEAEPRSDTGIRVFHHCALAHLGLDGRPIRPVVFYLTPGDEGRQPQHCYGWVADGARVLDFHFEAVSFWDLRPDDVLGRPAPGLWAAVALCEGATRADIRQARAQIEARVTDRRLRADLEAVACLLAARRFSTDDLITLFSQELLMESDLLERLLPALAQKWRREGLEKGLEEGLEKGLEAGLLTACRAALAAKGGELSAEDEARLASLGAAALERLLGELLAAQDAVAARAAVARTGR